MKEIVIKLSNVELDYLTPFYFPGKKRHWEKIKALQNINVEIQKGESIALLGDNGAGKSTLLKIIAGLLKPDKGRVEVRGKVRILSELGAGFNVEVSGWENIFIQGSLFGFSRQEMEEKANKIAKFASLGKYLYAPLKAYSEGMYVRLAFSIGIYTDPDIFLVDDIITVGDIHFQEKCIQRLEKMREEGKTLVIVTHSLPLAERLSSQGIWLEEGKIAYAGPITEVANSYLKLSGKKGKAFTIEEGKLRIAFQEGKIFILWDNNLLSPYYGGYTTITKNNNAVISPLQKWKMEKHSSGEIIARGDFLELPLSQTWKIKVISEREWEWEVIMEPRDKVRLEEVQTGLLLSEDYRFLWRGNKKEELPCYKGKEWKPFREEIDSSPFLISARSGSSYPAVLWEPFLKFDKKQIFLSGEETGGKAFYWGWKAKEWIPGKHLIFSGRMKLVSPALLPLKQAKKAEGDIYRIEEGQIKIFSGKHELTAPGGLALIFEYQGKLYLPDTGKIARSFSEREKEIRFTWEDLPLYALFRLHDEKDSLRWQIEMISEEKLALINPRVVLNLLPCFDKWFTLQEEGNFPENLRWFPHTPSPTSFLAVKGKNSPLLCFSIEENEDVFSLIEKRKEMIILQHFRGYRVNIEKGRNLLFKGKIALGEKEEDFYQRREAEKKEIFRKLQEQGLKAGNISFFLDRGRGRIFYRGREITSSWGLYVSILTPEGWRESFKGTWNVYQEKEGELVAEGRHFFLPLLQKWRLRVKDRGIVWSWEGKKEEKFNIREVHASLMLKDEYAKYEMGQSRSFPELAEDWTNLWEGKVKNSLRVKGRKNLPAVSFSGSSRNGIIKNSPSSLKGRVLEYRVDTNKMKFQGHIWIGDTIDS